MRALTLSTLAVLATGCIPKAYITVLEPADVALPKNIQTLAVIDRSRPSNVGQGILGTIEGALTGEAIGADREAGRQAVQGVADVIAASPRFDVVVPSFDRKGQGSNLFDRELSWESAKKICKANGAEGLVSLEALDSDSWIRQDHYIETYTDDNGRERRRTIHTAERETQVLTGWRVYSLNDAGLLDDMRDYAQASTWEEEGRTPEEARSRLPSQFDTVVSVGLESGVMYGQRIAPTYVDVARSFYAKGHDDLKQGKRYVRAGDWEGAEALWRGLIKSDDPKVRGRARFNLALSLEVQGELDRALETARKAAVDLHNGLSRQYVRTLEWRISDQRRLDEQMAPAPAPKPAPAPAEAPPRAVPVGSSPPPPKEAPVSRDGPVEDEKDDAPVGRDTAKKDETPVGRGQGGDSDDKDE
jgi:hypothetical protein